MHSHRAEWGSVSSILGVAKERTLNLLARFRRVFRAPGEVAVFESDVGVKYRGGCFASRRFDDYLVEIIPLVTTSMVFASLVMPPDLLRNRYTLCGRSLLLSPHYQLIQDMDRGSLASDSEYLRRVCKGTLDGRLPRRVSSMHLSIKFRMRQAELLSGETMGISVVELTRGGETVYVIADGKHRAALAAYYDRPEAVHLRVVSKDVFQTPFFREVYAFTLSRDSQEYSINQEMIEEMLNGS